MTRPLHRFSLLLFAAVVILTLIVASDAQAGTVTLTLRRASLINVDDAAGRWQYEGGTVLRGATAVGNYALTRRVVNGATTPQNTAMVTVTLFFNPERPPQNITLQGAHDFASGVYRGSVSAASNRFDWVRNATFVGNTTAGTLTITWLGSEGLTVP